MKMKTLALALATVPVLLSAQAAPARCSDSTIYFEFQVTRAAEWIVDTTLEARPAPQAPRPPNLLQFVIDTAGVPEAERIHPLRAADRALMAEALRSLPRWRFTPAVRGECKVRQVIQTAIEWRRAGAAMGTTIPLLPLARPGMYVRLSLVGFREPILVKLGAIRPDSITYRELCGECGATTVSRSSIARIEVRRETQSRWDRVLPGALIGAIVLTGAYVISILRSDTNCRDGPCGIGIIFWPVATGVGGLLGAVIGWFSVPDLWEPAAIPSET